MHVVERRDVVISIYTNVRALQSVAVGATSSITGWRAGLQSTSLVCHCVQLGADCSVTAIAAATAAAAAAAAAFETCRIRVHTTTRLRTDATMYTRQPLSADRARCRRGYRQIESLSSIRVDRRF
jgi:hypothetical protein